MARTGPITRLVLGLYMKGHHGGNDYRFVYAEDLVDACLLALKGERLNLLHVGSDNVPTLTNSEMLPQAYRYYAERRGGVRAGDIVSALSRPGALGCFCLLMGFFGWLQFGGGLCPAGGTGIFHCI